MRRLWTALISELTRRTTSGADISDALFAIAAPLRSQVESGKMKPALQALEGIISRQIVSVVDIARALSIDLGAGGDRSSETYQTLFRKMLEWATHPELTQTAGRAIAKLWTQLRAELQTPSNMYNGLALPLIWINPLVGTLADCPESIPRFKSHVFPELFLVNLADFRILLKAFGFYSIFPRNQEPPTEVKRIDLGICRIILFSVLDAGKHIGLVRDDGMRFELVRISANSKGEGGEDGQDAKVQKIQLDAECLQSLLIDGSGSVRISALSLVINSTATSTPYLDCHLNALRKSLPSLVIEFDPGVRGEILSIYQRFIDRMRVATYAQDHRRFQTKSPETLSSINRVLDRHKQFVEWLIDFLYRQLHPGAGYQNVIFSLRMFRMLCKSGLDPRLENGALLDGWGFSCTIMTPKLICALLTLTMNSFEDVRATASELLQVKFDDSPFSANDAYLIDCMGMADAMMLKSGRADHADGVSRLYVTAFHFASHFRAEPMPITEIRWWKEKALIMIHLQQKLAGALEQARADMSLAISESPLHGLISSIRYG
jgi:hypothetical protein